MPCLKMSIGVNLYRNRWLVLSLRETFLTCVFELKTCILNSMPNMCHDFVIYKKQAAMWFPVSSSSLQSHGLVTSRHKFFIPSQKIKKRKEKKHA